MRNELTVLAVLGVLVGPPSILSPADSAAAETSGQGVIYPGTGVDRLSLGAPAPDERTLLALRKQEGISVEAPNGTITRITVSSARYAVERSRLRPGAALADVLRFYGSGEKGTRGKLALLTYRAQGIEFAIDTAADRVRSIAVFPPVRQKAPVEQYRKLYQYREQFKAR